MTKRRPIRSQQVGITQCLKNVTLFIFVISFQISSDFANFWQKHTAGNLKQTHIHGPSHIWLYMFVLYVVKTSDASERPLRRRPLPVRLVIEPESCNFFKSLFKPLKLQLLSENLRINFLTPKTLHLYKLSIKMRTLACGAWMLHDLVWSAPACHWRGNRPCVMDGCAPVWELMDETSSTLG